MSLRSEIFTQLSTDASILGLLDSSMNIHFGYIDGDSLDLDQIVWDSRVATNEYTFDSKRSFDVNTVSVKSVSKKPVNMDNLAEVIKNSLVDFTSTKIKDCIYERDDYFYDENLNVHILNNEFTVWYQI